MNGHGIFFVFDKLITVFIIIIVTFLWLKVSKKKISDIDIKKIKKMVKGILAVFLGPTLCAIGYTFYSSGSMLTLILYGFLSFVICLLFNPLKDMRNQKNKEASNLKIEIIVPYITLIVPNISLYLLFLFSLRF